MAPLEKRPAGSLLEFFLIAFAIMWTCFITVAVTVPARTPLGQGLILLGAFAPSLAAAWCVWRASGPGAVSALFARAFRIDAPARLFLLAVLLMPAVKLTAAVIHRLFYGAWPRFGSEPWFLMLLAMAFSTPFQAGEEIGWRGYALPRLASRLGTGLATIVLGVLWSVWHLPQFFIREADTYGQSFWIYLFQVTALSVLMGWVVARSGGSLLPVMLFHSAVNNTKDIVPSASPDSVHPWGLDASRVAWLTVALLWACAAVALTRMPRTAWWLEKQDGA